MTARLRSRALVIDADVMAAAGEANPTSNVARACRRTLTAVLEICHRAAVSEALLAEWRRHSTRFARQWRVQMYARRKIAVLDVVEDEALRAGLAATGRDEHAAAAMLKDAHLIEAALASDRIVVSMDARARRLLAASTSRVHALRRIVWVNPALDADECVAWLNAGATAQRHRMLGRAREPLSPT